MRWAVCRCLAGRVRSSASHWDEMDKGTQEGPGPGLSARVTGRAGVPQGLPDRATMMVTLQGDLANTFTFDEVGSSNLFPLVHLEHSYLRLLDFILAYRNRLRWGHFLSSLHPEVGPFQTSIHMEIRVERSIAAAKVIDALEWLGLVRGLPEYIRSDNGPEFVAKAIQQWLKDNHCQTIYIEPGSPWENPYIESFNGKLRAECLDQYSFANGGEAQAITTGWREEYNQYRPHSSLSYQTPAEFAASVARPLDLVDNTHRTYAVEGNFVQEPYGPQLGKSYSTA